MESTATEVRPCETNGKGGPKLRRGNTVPAKLDLSSKMNGDFVELHHWNDPIYTSLRDILHSSSPAGIATPTTSRSFSCEIPIKNRLVKQAAYAYLQPMPSSPEIRGGFHCVRWIRGDDDSSDGGCFGFLRRFSCWLFDHLLSLICCNPSYP